MIQFKTNILLIDDDAEYATVARHYLSSFHQRKFDLQWINNIELALEQLSKPPLPDLILIDYYLPSSKGIEIIKQIVALGHQIPIILLTSNKDLRIAVEAMKFGVEDYLVKEELIDSVLPRSIISVLDRVELNRRIQDAETGKMLTQKKTEAVQELVVTMCHEFNNPLAAIKISTDILSRQQLAEEDRSLLKKLNMNITNLEKQIIKLRDFRAEK